MRTLSSSSCQLRLGVVLRYLSLSPYRFEVRKKKKYKRAEKFATKIKEIQEEAKTALEKVQEEMKKYVDRKRRKINELL